MVKLLRWLWTIIQALPGWTIKMLDWMVAATERLVVLAIAFIAFYSGWLAFRGGAQKSDTLTQILKALSDNWKGLLLLLVPLFYRTIRTFLEKVRKFAGMETEPEEKRTATPNEGE